jgi:hypothetical protein
VDEELDYDEVDETFSWQMLLLFNGNWKAACGRGAHNHVICSLKALQTTRHDLEKNGIAAHCRVRQKALLKKERKHLRLEHAFAS